MIPCCHYDDLQQKQKSQGCRSTLRVIQSTERDADKTHRCWQLIIATIKAALHDSWIRFSPPPPFLLTQHLSWFWCIETRREEVAKVIFHQLLECMQRHISFWKHLDISVIEHFPLLGGHDCAPAWCLFCAKVMYKLVNRSSTRNGLSTDQEIDMGCWLWVLSEGLCYCFIDCIYSIAISIR